MSRLKVPIRVGRLLAEPAPGEIKRQPYSCRSISGVEQFFRLYMAAEHEVFQDYSKIRHARRLASRSRGRARPIARAQRELPTRPPTHRRVFGT